MKMTRNNMARTPSGNHVVSLLCWAPDDTGGNLDKNPVSRFVVYISIVYKKGVRDPFQTMLLSMDGILG